MKQIGFAILTFAVYTMLINWKVALLLIVGVGFHEYSHLLAAKHLGLRTKGFYLVPFMGGVAFVTSKYERYSQQAFVVLMGPLGGGLLAVATAGLWWVTKEPFLAVAASWMCWLNLFNLLPLSFMDGGQLMDTVAYSLNRTLGMVLQCASTLFATVFLWHYNPVIACLVGFFGGSSCIMEVRNWQAYRNNQTYLCSESYLNPPSKMSGKQIALTLAGWVTTMLVLLATRYYVLDLEEANLSNLFR